ncbi:hypothetical protein LOK49_LG05G03392 [Camellia lanceoleosa]|uniref:Uncharacterized protein n=1 Tax=Camellia lanceoleosa TaxID=1840588 RepID=A0ACC0HV90_9ERIC|nr:hypothetical protein LOK49_LG05G03392 [Camellia lanceoleosa]
MVGGTIGETNGQLTTQDHSTVASTIIAQPKDEANRQTEEETDLLERHLRKNEHLSGNNPRFSSFKEALASPFPSEGNPIPFPLGSATTSLIEKEDDPSVPFDDSELPSINFSQKELTRICNPWNQSLIVKLMGRNVSYSLLMSRINSLWKPTGAIHRIDLANHYYLIKFHLDSDLHKVLKDGPWGTLLNGGQSSNPRDTKKSHPHLGVVRSGSNESLDGPLPSLTCSSTISSSPVCGGNLSVNTLHPSFRFPSTSDPIEPNYDPKYLSSPKSSKLPKQSSCGDSPSNPRTPFAGLSPPLHHPKRVHSPKPVSQNEENPSRARSPPPSHYRQILHDACQLGSRTLNLLNPILEQKEEEDQLGPRVCAFTGGPELGRKPQPSIV